MTIPSGHLQTAHAGNCKTIEATGVKSHPLPLTKTGRTVVLEHPLSHVVCTICVHASARVNRLHAFVAASVVTALVDTEAVCIRVAGLMTDSKKNSTLDTLPL